MDEYEVEKKCQSYEVTDFQHNFEIEHPTTTLQQWGLHIHSNHYELLVFIRGNAECWIEGRRKKLEYGDVVIVNPREIHRIFILDNVEYERIVMHVSDSMLKELSTAQTNLLRVFHKNRPHILHLSEEEMAQFVSNQLQMKKMWKKKEFGADLLGSAWFQILLLQISQKMRQAEGSGAWESVAGLVGEALEYVNKLNEGIVVCSYRFTDMYYTQLKEDLPDGFEMLLVASKGHWLDGEDTHIIKIGTPLKIFDLLNTVHMMFEAQTRRRKKNRVVPKFRTEEDRKVIKEAKSVLMDRNNMSESEAHAYLQKCSMDSGNSLVETAGMVICLYRC